MSRFRIVKGDTRALLPSFDAPFGESSVEAALDRFLGGLELGEADEVVAATARTLAFKLDQARASDSSASASAAPALALARELVASMGVLRPIRREKSQLDLIRERRDAKLASLIQ